MKNLSIILAFATLLLSCAKDDHGQDENLFSGSVVAYPAQPLPRTYPKRTYVHLMPWFETPESNNGAWGLHWRMNTRNPNIVDANGKRQIAAHYYPQIGPYASGDTAVIDYQLLLMKLSGVDAVLIDWTGKQSINDFPLLARNTEKIVTRLARAGMNFAIVYEDWPLSNAADKVGQAKKDMQYLQSTFFGLSNYEKINGQPLLLVFGPQQLQTPANWTDVFSVLSPAPNFMTLWYESSEAGANAKGEYAWIYSDFLTGLSNFYKNSYSGSKLAAVYPGFDTYYAEGGWAGPTWKIPANGTTTFSSTLDLALNANTIGVQVTTWNDYGEGTMIEPTQEFGYSLIATLQAKLGVNGVPADAFETVYQLYTKRVTNKGNAEALAKLDQVYYYLVSAQWDKAKKLLQTI